MKPLNKSLIIGIVAIILGIGLIVFTNLNAPEDEPPPENEIPLEEVPPTAEEPEA